MLALEEISRFNQKSHWRKHENGFWHLPFSLQLSVPSSELVAEETYWQLVVESRYPLGSVEIYPDKKQGIHHTFQHQSFNAEPDGRNWWRDGKLCLDVPAKILNKDEWSREPSSADERIAWHVQRALTWVDAAAANKLTKNGDPTELPALSKSFKNQTLGFYETQESSEIWENMGPQYGIAHIHNIPNNKDTYFVSSYHDEEDNHLFSPPWSSSLSSEDYSKGVWALIPSIPALAPWQCPSTWEELHNWTIQNGVQLKDILVKFGDKFRDGQPRILLLGFPISEKIGEPINRIHWLGIQNLIFTPPGKGLPGYPNGLAQKDKLHFCSQKPLYWIPTENWAPDQIRSRGSLESNLCSKKTLILGAGALGASIAEMLLRAGVTSLTLMDDDKVKAGNLTRHTLTLSDIGKNKAIALKARLDLMMPDSNVNAISSKFPFLSEKDLQEIQHCELIIDCTSSDDVLRSMSNFDWGGEKIFVSLSTYWKAAGLFAYISQGSLFPAEEALNAFRSVQPPANLDDAPREGLGCWHPVYPATSDDMTLLAAASVKIIRQAASDSSQRHVSLILSENGNLNRVS